MLLQQLLQLQQLAVTPLLLLLQHLQEEVEAEVAEEESLLPHQALLVKCCGFWNHT